MPDAAKYVVLQLLRAYKWAISPMFPPACRYVPTCSEYAMEAVDRFGVLRGSLMAIARLLRCHPLARGGFDPVATKDACHSEQARVSVDQCLCVIPKARAFTGEPRDLAWTATDAAKKMAYQRPTTNDRRREVAASTV